MTTERFNNQASAGWTTYGTFFLRSRSCRRRRPETMKIGGERSASGPSLRSILNSSHAEAAQPRPACATFSEEETADESAIPKPDRVVTGDAGHAHPADAAMGAAAWLRHQPGDPNQFQRDATSGYRIALPGAAPAGAAEVDQFGVEGLREQSTGQGLSPDHRGEKAFGGRTLALGATHGSRRGRPEPGREGE